LNRLLSGSLNPNQLRDLLEKSYRIKKRFLGMYHAVHAGHVGASLSCAEMLTFVAFSWMQEQDTLILSKGHAAGALYSTLAERGLLSEEEIGSFYKDGTYLAAHPPPGKIRGIPFATGSLGHGLSLSAGIVLAGRFKGIAKRAFCITSDGELDEGSTWEAAAFILQHSLKNVVWLIDRNRLQGFGRTEDIARLEPLVQRLSTLGFNAIECDGHDFASLGRAKDQLEQSDKPGVMICNTVKGKGWEPYEGTVDSHYLPMKEDQYRALCDRLASDHQQAIRGL
jgi:transketolase